MQSDIRIAYRIIMQNTSDNPAVKNGYYLEALAVIIFAIKIFPSLIFYNEVYNSDKAIGDDFLVRYIDQ